MHECKETTAIRIRIWSPTMLLTDRYLACLRGANGTRKFQDPVAVDASEADFSLYTCCLTPRCRPAACSCVCVAPVQSTLHAYLDSHTERGLRRRLLTCVADASRRVLETTQKRNVSRNGHSARYAPSHRTCCSQCSAAQDYCSGCRRHRSGTLVVSAVRVVCGTQCDTGDKGQSALVAVISLALLGERIAVAWRVAWPSPQVLGANVLGQMGSLRPVRYPSCQYGQTELEPLRGKHQHWRVG